MSYEVDINGNYLEYFNWQTERVEIKVLIADVLEYIEEECLNVQQVITNNKDYFDPACELEEVATDPMQYLKDNIDTVATSYYTYKLKK